MFSIQLFINHNSEVHGSKMYTSKLYSVVVKYVTTVQYIDYKTMATQCTTCHLPFID